MYSMQLQWKEFKVHLPDFENWARSIAGANYKGNSDDAQLTLWFDEEPSDQIKATIQSYWDSLLMDTENQKIAKASKRNRAVSAAGATGYAGGTQRILIVEEK